MTSLLENCFFFSANRRLSILVLHANAVSQLPLYDPHNTLFIRDRKPVISHLVIFSIQTNFTNYFMTRFLLENCFFFSANAASQLPLYLIVQYFIRVTKAFISHLRFKFSESQNIFTKLFYD